MFRLWTLRRIFLSAQVDLWKRSSFEKKKSILSGSSRLFEKQKSKRKRDVAKMRRMKCKGAWLLSCACRGDMRSLDTIVLYRDFYNAINLIWEWRCYSILCYLMKIFRLCKIFFRYLERYRDVTKGKYFRNV